MGESRDNSMRRLGRWAGRIRDGFFQGLRGEPESIRRVETEQHEQQDDRRKVLLRRTTIEEIEIHEQDRR